MRHLLYLCLSLLPLQNFAQCLAERVNLNCSTCTREQALDQLQQQIDCSLSFNASKVNLEESVNVRLEGLTAEKALSELMGEEFEYKQRGRHLMIIEKKPVAQPKSAKQTYIIEGYVKNAQSGEYVSSATVYTVGNKYSALTDERGYYRLDLNTSKEYVGLSYSKQQYFDTLIIVSPSKSPVRLDMPLTPRDAPIMKMPTVDASVPQRTKEVEQLPMVKILVPEAQSQTALNTNFLESIPVQFSVLPSIGTSRFTSGMRETALSLNLLAGYNAGVQGFEGGSLVNIVRQDVNGVEAAGIGNIVGGKVNGFQGAGVFNNVRGSIMGFQGAGVYNIVLDTIVGLQAAGVFNILNGTISGGQVAGTFNLATENMEGLQAAGLFNITKGNVKFGQIAGLVNVGGKVEGAQVAGILNYAHGPITGAQVAGMGNISQSDIVGAQVAGFWNTSLGSVEGSQIAGFVNSGKDVTGTQMAGFVNAGKDVNSQLSGFINVGRTVKGLQIGFLNVSDSTSGSFGFISFSAKGMHNLDIALDEVHPANISFRTGSHLFYNIFQFGFGSYYPTPLWSYGYGIGTHLGNPKNRATLHMEITARQLTVPKKIPSTTNLNLRFEPTVAIRLAKKTPSIVVGPSLNLILQNGQLVPDQLEGSDHAFAGASPPIFRRQKSNVDGYFWIGGKFAIRI